MTFRTIRHQFTLAIGLALVAAGASAAPGYVALGKSGKTYSRNVIRRTPAR